MEQGYTFNRLTNFETSRFLSLMDLFDVFRAGASVFGHDLSHNGALLNLYGFTCLMGEGSGL